MSEPADTTPAKNAAPGDASGVGGETASPAESACASEYAAAGASRLRRLRVRFAAELRGQPFPRAFLLVGVASLISALQPGWRGVLIYDRGGIEAGEWWRAWSGHFVHFGWVHFLADTGLWLIIGWVVERRHATMARLGVLLMPLAVTGAVYFFDPDMHRYAGLSGLNVGFLVFLALCGWQRSWRDWFWPAILAIHVIELVLEPGRGGGAIQFDDPTVRIATIAHIGGLAYGVAMWAWWNLRGRTR